MDNTKKEKLIFIFPHKCPSDSRDEDAGACTVPSGEWLRAQDDSSYSWRIYHLYLVCTVLDSTPGGQQVGHLWTSQAIWEDKAFKTGKFSNSPGAKCGCRWAGALGAQRTGRESRLGASSGAEGVVQELRLMSRNDLDRQGGWKHSLHWAGDE